MVLKKVFIILFWLISLFALGSDPKYPVSAIAKSLLKDAKAVIRKKEVIFEISSHKSAVEKVSYVVTILNKNGLSSSVLVVGYSKFTSVKKISATIYDQNGKIIHAGSATAVQDIAALSGYSLYEDFRLKVFDPKYASCPFTIEYSYEISYDGLLSYPNWIAYEDYNIAVEESIFKVVTPENIKFRYLERNMTSSKILVGNKEKTYEWVVTNLPAIKKELYSQSIEEYTPAVLLAPYDFEIDGYRGNCESWTNFGLWIKKLGETRDILNFRSQEEIKSLVAGTSSDIEKVKILYQYMQDKVRYVSIQVGIGGWQPIPANSVDEVSYGDCKALSNYMKSVLDVVGIKSYYTLVTAGEDAPPLLNEFPSNQFNHAILCVPTIFDTIWLECTDQQIPFGFLGRFTDDRKALIIKDSGGTVVRTKLYSINDNIQVRSATLNVSARGDIQSSIRTVYKGIKYDEIFPVLRMDYTDRKKFINNNLGMHNAELLSFKYAEDKSIIPSIVEDLNVNLLNYGAISGTKLILKPNLLSRTVNIPVRTTQRNSPVVIRRSYCEYDTLTYIIQGNYISEKSADFSLVTPFGEYKNESIVQNNKLIYIRSFKLIKGEFPKEKYNSFVDFFEKIRIEDNKQIVFTRI